MTNKAIIKMLMISSLFISTPVYATDYQIVSTETSPVGNGLIKSVSAIQVGTNPTNRFLMTKVSKAVQGEALQGIILLLPHLGGGFSNYEIGDNGEYDKSFAGFFATRNYEIWGYSQRQEEISAGSCESGAVDCSVMAGWGFQSMRDDIRFIRSQIELNHPGEKPIVGGISMGAALSVIMMNADPRDYAGAILIDGTIYDESPAVRAITANFCSMFESLLSMGIYYDGQGMAGLKMINNLAITDPNGISPIPGMPAGMTNHQVFIATMSVPAISPSTFRPNYFFTAGSVEEDRLFYSSESYWQAGIDSMVNYLAIRTLRDTHCEFAGEGNHIGNLHNFSGPVIIFAAGHGFDTAMFDTARLLTGARITMLSAPDYGHVDYYFSERHKQDLEEPIMRWLQQEVNH